MKPSVWRGYGRYLAVIGTEGDTPIVRERLLFDPELRVQVEEAEALLPRIAGVTENALVEAAVHYGAMSEEEVRAEADDVTRRKVIFDRVETAFNALAMDGWTS